MRAHSMVHSRRRSVSSSSSSSSDEEHRHKHREKVRESRDTRQHAAAAGAAPATPHFPPAFQRDLELQTHPPTTMSGPGFPSSPPPYGGESQHFVGMPNEQHFVPPPGPPPSFPSAEEYGGQSEHDRGIHIPGFLSTHHSSAPGQPSPTSPTHPQGTPPPSGFRVPLTTTGAFPLNHAGQPVSHDADGQSPIFLGSALFEKSVHPCKIAPALIPPCRVPYGGQETEHQGRYDLLPFDPNTMEWVPTSQGRIPPGRRPVEGGYEDYGSKLYHGIGVVGGIKVPGKTGEHLVSLWS